MFFYLHKNISVLPILSEVCTIAYEAMNFIYEAKSVSKQDVH